MGNQGFWKVGESGPFHTFDDDEQIRIARDTEPTVSERRNVAYNLQEPHLGSTEGCATEWRTELWEILRTIYARDCRFTVPAISQPPQESAMLDDDYAVCEIQQRVRGGRSNQNLNLCFNGGGLFFIFTHHSSLTTCSM